MTYKPSKYPVEISSEVSGSRQQPVVMLPKPRDVHRVETGAVQFGDDWPGVFIRGDNAAYYSMALDSLMAGNVDPITVGVLAGLNELLKSSMAT